jgi:membrane associated rhomboid family serine protease
VFVGRTTYATMTCRPKFFSRQALILLLIVLLPRSKSAFASSVSHYYSIQQRQTANDRPWRRFSTPLRQQPFSSNDISNRFIEADDLDHRCRPYNPLRSRKPNQRSWTTRITVATIACYLAQLARPSLTQWGMKLSERILAGHDLYRLITPMLLHGGLVHVGMNLYSLRSVGPDVERFFGPGRFVSAYVVAGVAGNLVSACLTPNPSLGASGAVCGIISAYYFFLARNEWILGVSAEQMTTSLGSTLLMNAAMGAMNPVIDNWAHLGGALGGAAMAYYFGPRLYYCDLDNGKRIVVDRPMVRLPKQIESIPANVGKRFAWMTRKMDATWSKLDGPDKPWRSNGPQPKKYTDSNRSIRPTGDPNDGRWRR